MIYQKINLFLDIDSLNINHKTANIKRHILFNLINLHVEHANNFSFDNLL